MDAYRSSDCKADNATRVAFYLTRTQCPFHTRLMKDDSGYSDAELEAATSLDLLHVRRLITWKAVAPVKGGKGVVRQWDRHAVRHIACVNALYSAGLSLPMAHTLGMLTPARFAIDIIDPDQELAGAAKLGWFNARRPLRASERTDIVLMIGDGYSVFWRLGNRRPIFVGKLSADRSVFLSALDYSNSIECDPASLSWEHRPELAEDPAQKIAKEILQHPVSLNTINLSLAARIAMRRLLKIPVYFE